MISTYQHFETVAPVYRQLRTTDEAPIRAIRSLLGAKVGLRVSDIGCGTGRYSQLLHDYLTPVAKMYCIDFNHAMLEQLRSELRPSERDNFQLIQGSATDLPLADGSLDVVTSFNAIHHFDLTDFLSEISRVLDKNGQAFLYTRLQDQNASNIWGRSFPQFCEKEGRLYTLPQLVECIERYFGPAHLSARPFFMRRQSSLDALIEQARGRHYSTFSLYTPDEFEDALDGFQRNIIREFPDLNAIQWTDSNTLISLSPP
jgi:ubiquinone/menaquinone biosynthesis C-methylase UbiE